MKNFKRVLAMFMVLTMLTLTVNITVKAEVDPNSGLTYTVENAKTVFNYKIGTPVSVAPGEFGDTVEYRFQVLGRTKAVVSYSVDECETSGGQDLIQLESVGVAYDSVVKKKTCMAGESFTEEWIIPKGKYYITISRRASLTSTYHLNITYGEGEEATDFSMPEKLNFECGQTGYVGVNQTNLNLFAHFEFAVSDPSIIQIDDVGNLKTLKVGKANVICTMNGKVVKTCEITVKKSRALNAPNLQDQVLAYSNKIFMTIDDSSGGVFQIYRSTKKTGKYKKVKTITKYHELGDYRVSFDYTQKKLKPGKRYYYKVRVKRKNQTAYSDFTKPKEFWTAPSIKVSKIRTKGKKVTWKKTKGANGYAVDEKYSRYKGINIFGQRVTLYNTTTHFVKKNSYRKKDVSYTAKGKYVPSTVKIRAYAKHGKKIYMHGTQIKNKTFYYSNTGGNHFYN